MVEVSDTATVSVRCRRQVPAPPSSASIRRCKVRRGERGAELLEFALVLPLLVLLLFGTIDTGFVLNDRIKLRQTTREAARLAAVDAYGTDGACLLTGPIAAGTSASAVETKRLICRAKVYGADAGLDVRVAVRTVTTPNNPSVGYAEGNRIVVCTEMMASSRSGMLGPVYNAHVLKSKVAMRISNVNDVVGPIDGDELPFAPLPAGSTDADITQHWNTFCNDNGSNSP